MIVWWMAVAWSAQEVMLPPSEPVEPWQGLLGDAGLTLTDDRREADVLIELRAGHWQIVARPEDGPVRHASMPRPATAAERAGFVWVLVSLLEDVLPAPIEPATPEPEPPLARSEPREPKDARVAATPPQREAPEAAAKPGQEGEPRPGERAIAITDMSPESPGESPSEEASTPEVIEPVAKAEEDVPLVDLTRPEPPAPPRRPVKAGVRAGIGATGRAGATWEARGELTLGLRFASGVQLDGVMAASGPSRPRAAPSAEGTALPELGLHLGWGSAGAWRPEIGGLVGTTQYRFREASERVAQGWVPWVAGRVAVVRQLAGPWSLGLEARVRRELRAIDVVVVDQSTPLSPTRVIVATTLGWTPGDSRRR
ncbi:MAG: hypothetical protein AAF211_07830 [Myxococcota bacterium]